MLVCTAWHEVNEWSIRLEAGFTCSIVVLCQYYGVLIIIKWPGVTVQYVLFIFNHVIRCYPKLRSVARRIHDVLAGHARLMRGQPL